MIKAGDVVAFYDAGGCREQAEVVEYSHGGRWANLATEHGPARYVPEFGVRDRHHRWCFERLETLPLAFDPALPPPNPLTSIRQWMSASTPTLTLIEALCLEEQAETMAEFVVTDGNSIDTEQARYAAALKEYSKLLREYPELRVVAVDANKLVDGHLDSAWVHLQAAAVIVGINNLAEAWSRLHKANVIDKMVDGKFVLNATGKVTKPDGWTAPDYTDLIKQEYLK